MVAHYCEGALHLNIQSAGMSAYRPNQELNNRLQTMMESSKDLQLNPQITKAVESVLKGIDDAIKNPDKTNVASLAEQSIQLLERIGEFDAAFLMDQFEEFKPNKKGIKGMVQEYINEKGASIDPSLLAQIQAVTATMQVSSDTFGTSDDSDSQDFHPALSNVQGLPGLEGNDMGAVVGFVQSQKEAISAWSPSSSSSSHTQVKSSYTVGAHMLSVIEDFSPDQLLDMLKGILERGIQDVGDIAIIMKLLGELGMAVPSNLLQAIENALGDFVASAATSMNITEFLSLMQEIQAVSSDSGADLFDNSELSSLLSSQMLTGSDFSEQDAQMASALGIDIVLLAEEGGAEVEGSESKSQTLGVSESRAAQESLPKSGFNIKQNKGLDKLAEEEDKNTLSVDAVKPVYEAIGDHVADLIKKELPSFTENLLDTLEAFYEKQLTNKLDNLF
jgi:hypothetical protein